MVHNKNSSRNFSTKPLSGVKKNYKKKEESIEYRFSNNIGGNVKSTKTTSASPYIDVEIPVDKIQAVFFMLREKYGETENIKEYSTYKNNDLELTVFPDGSSFCRQIIAKELKDINIQSGIFVNYKEKFKISNDYFPCKYVYNSSVDVVDVVFTLSNDIKIVLSTIYENNKNFERVKKVEDLGRPDKIKKSKSAWCEMYVVVDCSCDVENVHNTIKMLAEIFQ
jgi:hypothetical protein